jgi:hypothetical protein
VRCVETAELERQAAARDLIRQFTAFALREESGEAERLQRRMLNTCQTLFTLLATMVKPELLVEGEDEISGKHSSLKKLLKAKAREDASKAKYGTKNKDAAEKDAGAAKPPPKPGKPKDEGKGKGKGVKAEDDPLPLADFQLTEYPGLPVGDTNPLQVFLAKHPSVAVLPFFNDPSGAQRRMSRPDTHERKKKPDAKPPPKSAKGTAKGKGGAEVTDRPPEQELSPSIEGPVDKVFQSCIMCRNIQYDSYKAFYEQQTKCVAEYYDRLWDVEQDWQESFRQLVGSLIPSVAAARDPGSA